MVLFADWSSAEWLAVIAALGTQVVTILGVVFAYLKSRDNAASIKTVDTKVDVIHTATNSLVTRLVDASAAEGVARGTADERLRADAAKAASELHRSHQ